MVQISWYRRAKKALFLWREYFLVRQCHEYACVYYLRSYFCTTSCVACSYVHVCTCIYAYKACLTPTHGCTCLIYIRWTHHRSILISLWHACKYNLFFSTAENLCHSTGCLHLVEQDDIHVYTHNGSAIKARHQEHRLFTFPQSSRTSSSDSFSHRNSCSTCQSSSDSRRPVESNAIPLSMSRKLFFL